MVPAGWLQVWLRFPQAELKSVRAYKESYSTSELQASFGASQLKNNAQERAEEVIGPSLICSSIQLPIVFITDI